MPETLTVFLWSLPEELSFRDYLRSLADRLRVCPLRPAAWYAAERLFRRDEIFDCRSLIGPGEREEFDQRAADSASRLRAILQSYRREPWLQGFEFYHKVAPLFFYLYYWHTLLQRFCQQAPGTFRLYGPFSRGSIPGGLQLEMDILDLLVCEALAGPSRNLARAVAAFTGRLVAHTISVRSRIHLAAAHRVPRPFVLVAGLQETDTVFQTRLVKVLGQRLGRGVRWWRLRVSARLSGHEEAGPPDASVPMEWYESIAAQWPNRIIARCVQAYLVERVSTACRRLLDRGLIGYADALARIIIESHPDVVLQYLEVARYLNRIRPCVVVGSSLLGLMAHVRAWCRRESVPFIRLPHGLESPPQYSAIAQDADHVGVTGRYDFRNIQRSGRQRRSFLAGGLHLAEQGKKIRSAGLRGEDHSRTELCFLASTSLHSNYPDTFLEVAHDLRVLSRAAARVGLKLRIRPHPRSHDRYLYLEVRRNDLSGLTISDPARALSDDLNRAVAAVARIWSGACILALYARVPLVAWLPRPGGDASAARLARVPMVARNGDELKCLLERLLQDEQYRREVLERQDRLLEEEIEDPFGDEYGLAVRMVESLMNRRSLKLKGDLV